MRYGLLIVLVLCASLTSSCGGQGSAVPAPTPAMTNPVVTIEMTYTCHPCDPDPDHYQFTVDGGGYGRRSGSTTAETDTIRWTGPLTPGPHSIEVEIFNAETTWRLAFVRNSTPGNTGGIKPSSLRVIGNSSNADSSGAFDVRTFAPCGLVTKFSRRPKMWYDMLFEVDVVLGSPADVC